MRGESTSRRRWPWLFVVIAVLGAAAWWIARAQAPRPCDALTFEGSRFTACRYDPAQHDLSLVVNGQSGAPLRSFTRLRAELGERAKAVAFAMNAGMYDERGAPIGLYVEDGAERRALSQREGPGNFHLKPNGVFWVDGQGRAQVTQTEAFASAAPAARFASQSGPMLVIDGALHPAIAENGASLYVRNGVGACGENGGAVFVISEERVSFGRLARLYRDELRCRNALYFDGSVSSLWSPHDRRMDSRAPLGPLVVVFDQSANP